MPIRPENKPLYAKDWKTRIRPEILARAGNRCEFCQVPNYAWIKRVKSDPAKWILATQGDNAEAAFATMKYNYSKQLSYNIMGFIQVVLTIAHLNHNPADNRPENLRALCRKCHNTYDGPHRAETRKRTRLAANINQTKLF